MRLQAQGIDPRAVPGHHRQAVRRPRRRAARGRRGVRQGRPRAAGRRRGRGASRAPTTTSTPSSTEVAERVGEPADRVRGRVRTRRHSCRRYARTSGSARRSTGCSSGSRSSTRTARPSTAPTSRSARQRRPGAADDRRRRRTDTTTTDDARDDRRGDARDRPRRPTPADGSLTRSASTRRDPQLPGPHGRRADQPGRAGLRPLLPAAQGEHHLPGHADRRHDRQPDLRPAAAPRVGEPRQGHQHLHQQPRRRHHRAVRHLRHDAVHQARHHHDLLRAGRLGGRRAAGGRHDGQAPGPARTPGSCSTSPAARPAGQATDIEIAAKEILRMRDLLEEILAHHTGQTVERIHKDTDRDFVHDRRGGQGVRHHRRGDLVPAARRQTGPDHARPADRTRPGERSTWPSSETVASC